MGKKQQKSKKNQERKLAVIKTNYLDAYFRLPLPIFLPSLIPATKKDFRSSRGAHHKIEDLQFSTTFVNQSTIDRIFKK
ncbi:hypothetical protein [Epilithonimonas xixisoli]|uniref:hypothetical protein n=1 Tax=Epilithonimonas xixisoli TaxID=1476462 RepID=UPI001063B732|nr:hypothetical protein [Epilithonimonas xixisoli]